MKLTKIIATIGPATESSDQISKLIDLGVNIFRFNLKHNDLSWHAGRINEVKRLANAKGKAIGTLIDLQGPEIRTVVNEAIPLRTGEEVGVNTGNGKSFTISHPDVLSYLAVGQKVVVDDGRMRFEIKEAGKDHIVLVAKNSGEVVDKKTFNIPGATFPMPTLTEKDREAVKMASEVEVDFIALSFVRSASDIFELKNLMKENNVNARVISKIETSLAIDNLDEIIAASEGLMVARGDLGIELPMEQVPFYQKLMIKKCIERGIPVITATQMLHSMVANPFPTRAEISDVSNAVYDLTDAVMLSEETAAGSFPVEAVETMKDTATFTEVQDFLQDTRTIYDFYKSGSEEIICETAYSLYLQFKKQKDNIGGFIVFSETGRTGRKLSRYRPKVPIFVFTPNERVKNGLTMSFGVDPFIQPRQMEANNQVRIEDMREAFDFLVKHEHVDPEKRYILLYGDSWGVEGGVSTVKVVYPGNLD